MSNLSQKKGYKSHLVKKAAVALTVFTMASAGVVAIDSAHSEDAYAATALKTTKVAQYATITKNTTRYSGTALKNNGTTKDMVGKTVYVQYSFKKGGKTYYKVLANGKHYAAVEKSAVALQGNKKYGQKHTIANRPVQLKDAAFNAFSSLNTFAVKNETTTDNVGAFKVAKAYYDHYNGQRYYAIYNEDGSGYGFINSRGLVVNRADFKALELAIIEAEKLNEADYTKASFDAFKAELAAAKATFAKVRVTQAELDEAVTKLDAATKALVKELRVESVSAINNKEVLVTFNTTVDKKAAEATANYTFKAASSTSNAVTASSVSLQEDNKSVIVTLSAGATNQETYTVTVKDVKTEAGLAMAKTEKDVKFFDVTAPTVEGLTVVAPRTVKVDFSEPMATAPVIKLDNGSISTSVTLSDNGRSANVVFGIEPTIGEHALEIQGGLDFADLKVEKTTQSFLYEKDTTAPTVSISKSTVTTVTLKFSKPVKIQKAADVTVYHTFNNSEKYSAEKIEAKDAVNGYSDTYEVKFDAPMAEGTKTIFLNTKENALEDGWGNDVASVELTTDVVIDKTAPTVTSVKAVSDKKLEVVFDKKVESADATKLANYTLTDANGKALSSDDYNFVNKKGEFLSSVSVTYNDDKKTATIELPKALAGGNYTLTVKDIKDTTYLENKLISQSIAVTVGDTTAWELAKVTYSEVNESAKIRVTFNEEMSAEGLTNLANYELRNASAKVNFPEDTKVVVLNSKTVEIQLGDKDLGSLSSGYTLRVSGVLKDLAGNTFGQLFTEKAIVAEAGPALVADSAKTTATNQLQFKVDQELTGSLNPTNFTLNNAKTVAAASYVNNNGQATVTLTLTSDQTFTADAKPTVTVKGNALENMYGVKNGAFDINVADGIAPSVAKDSENKLDITSTDISGQFEINFNEVLSTTAQELIATDLIIKDVNGDSLTAGVDYTTVVNDTKVVVSLTSVTYERLNLTVSSIEKPNYIKDASGNKANGFGEKTIALTATKVKVPGDMDNILYLTKRGTNASGAQLAVDNANLVNLFTSSAWDGIKGKNHANAEVAVKEYAGQPVEENGLTVDLTVADGYLVLGNNTKMTKLLFNAIKASEGANPATPYYITVTNGKATNPKTKVAVIAFYLENDEVVAKLLPLN